MALININKIDESTLLKKRIEELKMMKRNSKWRIVY